MAQQLALPNLFETATSDIIDEDKGIQDIKEGTLVVTITNIIKD